MKQTKKALFIDRDGTLILEPEDEQIDSLEKLEFYPGVFQYLGRIATELDFELVMVTNQDGLGTDSFPEGTFWPAHNKMVNALEKEGITFSEVCIDRSFPNEKSKNRKPETGMLEKYMGGNYNLADSFVIGDRITDMVLAKNLGSGGIWLDNGANLGIGETNTSESDLVDITKLKTEYWKDIYVFLRSMNRRSSVIRNTKETKIQVDLILDGDGNSDVSTGLRFFDHMLDQIARHSGADLFIRTEGDLDVDEHHTIEDTGICLGEAFLEALGDKSGISRYGYCLPMDDCLAKVAIDFGGRPWIEWSADFKREMIGKMPTEMFFHFFKSFSDAARCNLNINAEGKNEHHKIEAIFKAFARSLKMAIQKDMNDNNLPTTKGSL